MRFNINSTELKALLFNTNSSLVNFYRNSVTMHMKNLKRYNVSVVKDVFYKDDNTIEVLVFSDFTDNLRIADFIIEKMLAYHNISLTLADNVNMVYNIPKVFNKGDRVLLSYKDLNNAYIDKNRTTESINATVHKISTNIFNIAFYEGKLLETMRIIRVEIDSMRCMKITDIRTYDDLDDEYETIHTDYIKFNMYQNDLYNASLNMCLLMYLGIDTMSSITEDIENLINTIFKRFKVEYTTLTSKEPVYLNLRDSHLPEFTVVTITVDYKIKIDKIRCKDRAEVMELHAEMYKEIEPDYIQDVIIIEDSTSIYKIKSDILGEP